MLLSILNQEEMARLQENLEKLKAQGSEDDSEEKVNLKSIHSRPTLELTLLTPRVVVRRIPFACNFVIECWLSEKMLWNRITKKKRVKI